MFKDRSEAGRLLSTHLLKFKSELPIVFAIPRGGVPVAYEIAKALNVSLELILIKKIGHPSNKEYAIGAASINDYFISPGENVSKTYIEEEVSSVRKRLKEMQVKFFTEQTPKNIRDKVVILVDDGIATGKTISETISVLRKLGPKKIIVAAPVASKHSVNELLRQADEVITILNPDELYAIGTFYENFSQVSDEDVIQILKKSEISHIAV